MTMNVVLLMSPKSKSNFLGSCTTLFLEQNQRPLVTPGQREQQIQEDGLLLLFAQKHL